MRKEVENVIKTAQKESDIMSSEFKQFLIDRGLTEKVYAPRKYKGISFIDSKEVTFNINANDKVGDTKTISYNGEKQSVTINAIEIEETDLYKYPCENDNPYDENYQCYYAEILISLTDEELTELYKLYERFVSHKHDSDTDSEYAEKPISTILNIIGIVLCIAGFILGVVAGNADRYDFNYLYMYMITVWIATFIQATLFFALAAIIQLLNKIQWQQTRK